MFFFVGYFSWRNAQEGSWLIQELCKEFAENAYEEHLLILLTAVCRRIATEKESYVPNTEEYHQKKQVPQICSTLLKLCHFDEKKKSKKYCWK